MATATRTLTRTALRSSQLSPFTRSATRVARAPINKTSPFRSSFRRTYADSASPNPSGKGGNGIFWGLGLGVLAGLGYYGYTTGALADIASQAGDVAKGKGAGGVFTPTKKDYQQVYDYVAKLLEEHDEYEDGSYGPVLLRLGWHASGTYDKETGTGGSNGATMRFAPEGDHGANAGLKAARDFLEPVKEKFSWITYSDLWTLAAVCAIQEMQGPTIPWRPGRSDRDVSFCTPDGRLPDATKGSDHLRAIFGRMGFNDAEIVALSGAHALGRCHTDRSGFDGPWTFSPTILTNEYFRLLINEKWVARKWNGPKQYQDKSTKSLMMLPTDMVLVQDKKFKPHVERFAKDNEAFFKEFSDVVMRLFELGVPFQSSEDSRIRFESKVQG